MQFPTLEEIKNLLSTNEYQDNYAQMREQERNDNRAAFFSSSSSGLPEKFGDYCVINKGMQYEESINQYLERERKTNELKGFLPLLDKAEAELSVTLKNNNQLVVTVKDSEKEFSISKEDYHLLELVLRDNPKQLMHKTVTSILESEYKKSIFLQQDALSEIVGYLDEFLNSIYQIYESNGHQPEASKPYQLLAALQSELDWMLRYLSSGLDLKLAYNWNDMFDNKGGFVQAAMEERIKTTHFEKAKTNEERGAALKMNLFSLKVIDDEKKKYMEETNQKMGKFMSIHSEYFAKEKNIKRLLSEIQEFSSGIHTSYSDYL